MSEVSGVAMTQDRVAVAIVAACAVTDVPPQQVFEPRNGRARVLAAAACVSRLGWDRKATARVFRVHVNRLTPSGLTLARVTVEDLLTVAEALQAAGMTAGDDPKPATKAAKARAANPVRPAARSAVVRMKPVTDRIVGWTRQQMRLGVGVDLMAELFDVDARVLAQAVEPMGVAA